MDVTELISRRLDTAGCVIVGTQIAANIEAYNQQGKKLPEPINNAFQKLKKTTDTINDAEKTDAPMVELDRAVDRCAYAIEALGETTKRIFANPELLSLNDDEKNLLAAMEKAQASIYPQGTDFLRLTFRRQWKALQSVKKAIIENASTIVAAGISVQTNRLVRWIDLYGIKLGITEAGELPLGSMQHLMEQWHEDLGNLHLEARYHCRDPKNPEHIELYQIITGPYQQQLEAERKADRPNRPRRAPENQNPAQGA